ncbi:MAG: stage V sporulation protein AA [Lachnospiraceae bacterium]|nr:stage V sporulation protein AA [Lachnospiraceae bacterium]
MAQTEIYIKMEQNTEVTQPDVFLKDIAQIVCTDSSVEAKVKAIKVHKFREDGVQKVALSLTKIITMIGEICPEASVQNIGETDALIELVNVNKHKGLMQTLKIIFVAAVSFFGTAFTIMAYHNDIGIADIFEKFYIMVMGNPGNSAVLEVFYSIGLSLGIIIFFNHIGGRRITKDPTPIEVEMRIYESDVNKALIETASREGKEEN